MGGAERATVGKIERDGQVRPTRSSKGRHAALPCRSLPVEQRLHNFKEVALGFTREMAMAEARRCLRCDLEAGGHNVSNGQSPNADARLAVAANTEPTAGAANSTAQSRV